PKHAHHVDEARRLAEIGDQARRTGALRDRGDALVAERRRGAREPAEIEVRRDVPLPRRGLDDGQVVIRRGHLVSSNASARRTTAPAAAASHERPTPFVGTCGCGGKLYASGSSP